MTGEGRSRGGCNDSGTLRIPAGWEDWGTLGNVGGGLRESPPTLKNPINDCQRLLVFFGSVNETWSTS